MPGSLRRRADVDDASLHGLPDHQPRGFLHQEERCPDIDREHAVEQFRTRVEQISAIGKTGFPSSVTATGDPNYYKLCIGTLSERQVKLRKAFSLIMDDGIAVVMVK